MRRSYAQGAEAEVVATAARLAERLNLDPSVNLRPLPAAMVPIDLIDPNADTAGLVQYAVGRRPDIAATVAEIGRAEAKLKEEIAPAPAARLARVQRRRLRRRQQSRPPAWASFAAGRTSTSG